MLLAPQKKGNQALGRSRGGLTTKVHAVVEGLGNLALWKTTGGQVHDSTQAEELLNQIPPPLEGDAPRFVFADKAYDSDAILAQLVEMGVISVIPPRANRLNPQEFDSEHYKNRNLIERFFCRIKQFRRVATRYDKLVSRFDSFIALASAFIWLA
jgi:transposase